MTMEKRTEEQLVAELHELRRRLADMETRQEAYEELFDRLPVGIYRTSPGGRFLKANACTARILGYDSAAELVASVTDIGRQLYGDPAKRDEVLGILRKRGVLENLELPYHGRGKSPGWVSISARPVCDEAGNILYQEGMIQDITDRKAAEEERRQAGKKSRELLNFLQTLFDTIPSPIFCKDRDGRYEDCNREFEVYVGKPREEIVGRTAQELFSPEMADKYREMDAILFREPGRQVYEHQIVYADGTVRDVVVNKATYPHADGSIAGIVGVMVDITARKAAERQIQAALREKERLLHEIHHRVKNNMQVITCLLDLQAVSSGDPEAIRMAEESNKRIRSMALVHEKLYESKEFFRINLVGYMRDLAAELSQSYKIDPGKITYSIQAEREVFLNMDRAVPCGLVLSELFSNACKHAFPGDRRGEIKVVIAKTPAGETEIVVRDNGVGLRDRTDAQRPRSVGLYLVRGLVKNQLGGQLETRVDNGTEFRIRFH